MARPVPTHPAVMACGDVPEFDISLIILLIGIRLQQIRNAGCLFRIVRQAHLSLPLTASMRIDGSGGAAAAMIDRRVDDLSSLDPK